MSDTKDFINGKVYDWTTTLNCEDPLRRLIVRLVEKFPDHPEPLHVAVCAVHAAQNIDDPLSRPADLGRLVRLGIDRQGARDLIEAVRRELTGEHDKPLELVCPWDLARKVATGWRVKGILPITGLVLVIGPPGAGKSLGALDLVGANAQGRDWFGHRVSDARPFVWLALEGAAGTAARFAAYGRHWMPLGSADAAVMLQPFDLTNAADRRRLIDAIRATDLERPTIVLDTLARAMPGRDENASADMGLAIAGATHLIDELQTVALLVHHTGKDSTKGPRGHSSLLAAADVVLEFRRNGPDRSFRLAKSKDGEDGAEFSFRLRSHVLEHDADGDAVTSCSIEPLDTPPPSSKLPKLAGTNVGDALQHLLDELDATGRKPTPGEIPGDLGRVDLVASYDAWAERFKARYDPGANAAAKRNALSKARRILRTEHHAINGYGEWVWVTPADASAEARSIITRHWADHAREGGNHA